MLRTPDLDEGDYTHKFSHYFNYVSVLGNGAFGFVVAATDKKTQELSAVKVIKKGSIDQASLSGLRKEARLLSQFNHPNIVQFKRIIDTDSRLLIVMECVNGGQLRHLIQQLAKEGKSLDEFEASIVLRGITEALAYVHMSDTIHRDLKPENILLADKENLSSIKLIDFGLSAQYDVQNIGRSFSETCGTKIYMAPEIFNKSEYSKSVDIWSLGIIMYQLLNYGKHPFYEPSKDNTESYHKKIISTTVSPPSQLSDLAKHLMVSLLQIDPSKRYTAMDILSHPWITRNFSSKIPLTMTEKLGKYHHEQILMRIMKAIMFTSRLRKLQDSENFRVRLDSYNDYVSRSRSGTGDTAESDQSTGLSPLLLLKSLSHTDAPTAFDMIDSKRSIIRPLACAVAENEQGPTTSEVLEQQNSSLLASMMRLNHGGKTSPRGANKDFSFNNSLNSSRVITKNPRGSNIDGQESIRKNRATNVTATIYMFQSSTNNNSFRISSRNASLTNIMLEDEAKNNNTSVIMKKDEKPSQQIQSFLPNSNNRNRSSTISIRAASSSIGTEKRAHRHAESNSPIKIPSKQSIDYFDNSLGNLAMNSHRGELSLSKVSSVPTNKSVYQTNHDMQNPTLNYRNQSPPVRHSSVAQNSESPSPRRHYNYARQNSLSTADSSSIRKRRLAAITKILTHTTISGNNPVDSELNEGPSMVNLKLLLAGNSENHKRSPVRGTPLVNNTQLPAPSKQAKTRMISPTLPPIRQKKTHV